MQEDLRLLKKNKNNIWKGKAIDREKLEEDNLQNYGECGKKFPKIRTDFTPFSYQKL